jgi:head-tail adaptor
MRSTSVIAQIRSVLNRWLNETATIQRETETRGAYGEQLHDWTTTATDVPCRVIGRNTQRNQAMSNQEMMVDEYRVIFETGTVLDVDYRVTVGGNVYRVIAIVDDRTDGVDVQAIVAGERA